MQTHSEEGGSAEPASAAALHCLGNSLWQAPKLEISGVKTWASITAVSYRRGNGESIWRSDRHRLILTLDPLPSMPLQVEQGQTRQMSAAAAGSATFYPSGLYVRVVHPAARFVQVIWDTDLYSALLPELGAAVSGFEFLYALQDPLVGQIVTTLAQEIEGGLADRLLVESLGTALCISLARRFVGRLLLPTSKGLSSERLQRVRDYVEAHLDEDLSLTLLAGIACLSPYHFSRSFKEATGVGPQRFVIQRRLERAKALIRRTNQPLASIAQEVGFTDQSHLSSIFRREMGLTPGRFRAALA